MADGIELTQLVPTERSRAYHFPGGEIVVLEHVTHFVARPSGTHRLKTADGRLHIIPTGWLHIELVVSNFTL